MEYTRKRNIYNGHIYESQAETQFAFFCEQLGIEYDNEVQLFYGFCGYKPDFELKSTFVEIKGCQDSLTNNVIQKMGTAMMMNPELGKKGIMLAGPLDFISEWAKDHYETVPCYTRITYNRCTGFTFHKVHFITHNGIPSCYEFEEKTILELENTYGMWKLNCELLSTEAWDVMYTSDVIKMIKAYNDTYSYRSKIICSDL